MPHLLHVQRSNRVEGDGHRDWYDRANVAVFLADSTFSLINLSDLRPAANSEQSAWELERKITELAPDSHLDGGSANSTLPSDGSRVVFVFDDYGVVVNDMKGPGARGPDTLHSPGFPSPLPALRRSSIAAGRAR